MLSSPARLLLLLSALLLASPALAQEQEGITIVPGTVQRATSVHSKPGAREPIISRLPANATVRILSPERRRGFWRVILDRGRQGYILENDVTVPDSAMLDESGGADARKPPCKEPLSACTPQGCAPDDSDKALFNTAKNHLPGGTRSVSITFPDIKSLQRQADTKVEQGKELSHAERNSISNLTVANGRVGEGKLAKLIGFIVKSSDPHANTGESVNCNLPRPENNDFHISLALKPTQSEFQGIVVEMIPHDRPAQWTLEKLRKVKRDGRMVMVVGGLFYDNDHVVNADPADDLGGQPKRFSLWEIHPITQFFVCQRAGNACSASNVAQWTKLEDLQ